MTRPFAGAACAIAIAVALSVALRVGAQPPDAPVLTEMPKPNGTPVPREDYWLGVPDAGRYEVVFDSDHPGFGGSGFAGVDGYESFAHDVHGYPYAMRIRLPPLAAVFLRRK